MNTKDNILKKIFFEDGGMESLRLRLRVILKEKI